ncbi:hypothetical protein HK105_207421 [Polyrhizophydium stewartii]|uniref:Uncharacterized protein n=1 Tax=Polyrhizophydium stewartii TaxID=2732419 RepID=A0ABR4N0N3_9FUNG
MLLPVPRGPAARAPSPAAPLATASPPAVRTLLFTGVANAPKLLAALRAPAAAAGAAAAGAAAQPPPPPLPVATFLDAARHRRALFESTDPADADDADVLARLRHHIDGEHVEHIDLAALRDMPAIAKIYGIDPSLPPAEAEALILGAMALQGNQ